ncbi:kanamycin kinase [Bogoriella caseilytica]|uniref:Kanamycin kinase n=2 Tax=Bogoriella caseilytica TaxID=56055 RepID=A0A3N2BGP0_9MICO|nr:kanamycin kinase [Bogoriella caseilytica]
MGPMHPDDLDTPVTAPERVLELADGAPLTLLWRNQLGGVTFRAERASGAVVIKCGPHHAETSFAAEAARMRWAAQWIAVPQVLEHGSDATWEWLITAALPGESAVAPRWREQPAVAVRAVGQALRALHDALPVEECPWRWEVTDRIVNATSRGHAVPEHLRQAPPIDQRVVCHADACCPNTLLGAGGRWLAHVDLGQLGTGDRWGDIAVASMSTTWNYGPGWDDALIEAYGVEPDRERLAYYRELWNAT